MSVESQSSSISGNLWICDFNPTREIQKLINLCAGSNIFGTTRSFDNVSEAVDAQIEYLMDNGSSEIDPNALAEEAENKLAARRKIIATIQQASGGYRPTALETMNKIDTLYVWGPWAEYQAYEHLKFSQRDEIDEAGGVESFMRKDFAKKILEELERAYTYGKEKKRILTNMLKICLDPSFEELPWLLDQAGRGHVALLEEAELKFNNRGSVYIQGHGYDHPILGVDKEDLGPSARDSGITTSNVVKLWPNKMMARTESRFYLAPNEIRCRDRISSLLVGASSDPALADIYKFLSEYEIDGLNFGDAGYSKNPTEREKYADVARRLEDIWHSHIDRTTSVASAKPL